MATLSEHDRDQAVRDLTRHCGDGRLTLDELEERITAAYAATSNDDLRALLHDLPTLPDVAAPTPTSEPARPASERPSAPAPPAPVPEIHRSREAEKALGTLFTIGGFVLLFNGMFWLALICWFVLPGLVLRSRRG